MNQFLDTLTEDQAIDIMVLCFPHRGWARRMVEARPFTDVEQLLQSAEHAWQALHPLDWLTVIRTFGREASAVDHRLTVRYEMKFGFPFVIAPADRLDHAAQLLERLEHSLAEESLIAAGAMKEISRKKLLKLWAQ